MGLQNNCQEHPRFTTQDFSILSFATDMSHSLTSPSFAKGTMENSVSRGNASGHRPNMRNQRLTDRKDQRWLVHKEEEKPVRTVMKSKNKPVFLGRQDRLQILPSKQA